MRIPTRKWLKKLVEINKQLKALRDDIYGYHLLIGDITAKESTEASKRQKRDRPKPCTITAWKLFIQTRSDLRKQDSNISESDMTISRVHAILVLNKTKVPSLKTFGRYIRTVQKYIDTHDKPPDPAKW